MRFPKTSYVLPALLFHSSAAVPTRLHKRIPAVTYERDQFKLKPQGTAIVILDNGITSWLQPSDSNFVIRQGDTALWSAQVSISAGCITNDCLLAFQIDGDLVMYFNKVPTWASQTSGRGAYLTFFAEAPYLVIYDAAFQPIWHTPMPTTPSTTQPGGHGNAPCGEFLPGLECNNGPPVLPSPIASIKWPLNPSPGFPDPSPEDGRDQHFPDPSPEDGDE